eukprot:SAG22_NODE_2776_length_2222_cov_3.815827_1_plen_190_part_00
MDRRCISPRCCSFLVLCPGAGLAALAIAQRGLLLELAKAIAACDRRKLPARAGQLEPLVEALAAAEAEQVALFGQRPPLMKASLCGAARVLVLELGAFSAAAPEQVLDAFELSCGMCAPSPQDRAAGLAAPQSVGLRPGMNPTLASPLAELGPLQALGFSADCPLLTLLADAQQGGAAVDRAWLLRVQA